MDVGFLMTRKVHRVRCDTGIRRVADIMRTHDIGALPVERAGRLVGMVTDRDIVTRIIGNGARSATAVAGDAMTAQVFYVFDDEDAEAVAQNMSELQVRRMPVVDRGKRMVGIVSLGDLACRIRPEVAGDALEGISEEPGASG